MPKRKKSTYVRDAASIAAKEFQAKGALLRVEFFDQEARVYHVSGIVPPASISERRVTLQVSLFQGPNKGSIGARVLHIPICNIRSWEWKVIEDLELALKLNKL